MCVAGRQVQVCVGANECMVPVRAQQNFGNYKAFKNNSRGYNVQCGHKWLVVHTCMWMGRAGRARRENPGQLPHSPEGKTGSER